ncbi:serine hydrolase domain-containing protein [Rufibacter psychrotolerans]|uniref:serine hydrolase domain-containing protein n=1 Tax=Rufibacter psychrotolerans TaxID=2812556 RepID=UPI0019672DC5|nr:serine hydrolase domain-containing protein [Rufibacter sp. SYSU D00308]
MKETLPQNLATALDQELEAVYAPSAPGIIVSVTRKGQVLYEKSIGWANALTGERIGPQSNFRMASLTKQFTAVGLALLEQAGALSFQSRFADFFPQLGELGQQITLQHLLTHTSGLRDYEPEVAPTRPYQVTDAEVLEITARQPGPYFPPGSQFRYSNTGYVLLGLIIEKVAQKPFGDFLREAIFQPLGMAGTRLYHPHRPSEIQHRALGYAREASGRVIAADQSPCSATRGDGCLYTSLHDYRLWHQALLQGNLVDLPSLLQRVHAPVQPGTDRCYGMGWFFTKRATGDLELCHTGNSSGFSHLVVSLPREEVLITAFSNLADNPHLLPGLLQTVLYHAPFQLESALVWQLPALTR